ncbi:hypothetical protein [Pseudonocardia sp. HH130629-09]|uniref:hypothetical protein n=1 Tax=Pseudonocardia sp. HH130629-09 TaxID=1641402 RepID=UPI0006CB3773|nr:hypothetical protein [Pseudonocardia sp. HH130629-09]ALE83010.1 hypothetical protein XF36_07450 [Pseudonocardia sp. HH130629-09]
MSRSGSCCPSRRAGSRPAVGPQGAILATAIAPAIGFVASTVLRWDPEREPAAAVAGEGVPVAAGEPPLVH